MKIINIECMESIKFICSFSFLIEISMRGLLLGASVIGERKNRLDGKEEAPLSRYLFFLKS